MATLTASKIKDTYKSLLKVGTTANSEITGSLKTIEDGNDNDTALQLSSAGVKSTGTLDVTGVTTLAAVTATTGSFSSTLGVTGLATFVNLTTTGTTTLGDSGDATTVNGTLGVTGNLTVDTNTLFVDAAQDRVGIGTVAPKATLDVVIGTSPSTVQPQGLSMLVQGGNKTLTSENSNFAVMSLDAMGIDKGGSIILGGIGGTTELNGFAHIAGRKENGTSGQYEGYLQFGVSDIGSDMHEKMRISSAGNVGIGTVAPNFPLQVHSTAVGVVLHLTNATTGNLSSDGFQIAFSGAPSPNNDNLQLYFPEDRDMEFYTNASEKMRITRTGNVGIGQTSPSHILHINGAGRSTQSAWDTTSDERTKTNIELADLQKCYDVVKSLALKRFTYKDEIFTDEQIKDRTQLGWIAQEVKQVFPKAVNESDLTYNQKYENVIIPAIDEAKDEDGNITIQAQAERTEKKLISEDKIENCLNLNVGQIYSSMYGAIQLLIQKVEALEAK